MHSHIRPHIRHREFPIQGWLSIASVAMFADLFIHHLLMGLLLNVGIFAAIAFSYFRSQEVTCWIDKVTSWSQIKAANSKALICAIFVGTWILYATTKLTMAPAHAAFLDGAETAFDTLFTTIGGTNAASSAQLVGVIFGLLRLIFVIFVVASIIRIVAANRNDDDWVQLAKTPAVIAVTIFVGDFIVGIIVN